MSITNRRYRTVFGYGDAEVDLVPLIDCIFLLLLFFMLCGHLSDTARAEQITVPPATTATTPTSRDGWQRIVVNIERQSRNDEVGIALGANRLVPARPYPEALAQLRALLDQLYLQNPTYDDPAATGLRLPQVVVEIRAGSDVPYRAVQELEQVLADSIEPLTGLPRAGQPRRPFPTLEFAVRDADGG